MKNNSSMEVSTLIKIIVGVLIFFGLVYFFTENVVTKKNAQDKTEEEVKTSNEIIVGTSLSQSEEKYYVLFFDKESEIANYFNSWEYAYLNGDKKPKLYSVYLNMAINKPYISDEAPVTKIEKVSDFKLKNGTLIVVEKGKVTNYIEDLNQIANLLK